jgi:hypothetical protein
MKKILLPATLLLVSLSASAEQTGFTAYGVYEQTCGVYLSDITDANKAEQYRMWVSGFITRANIAKGRATNTDPSAHDTWLQKYCKENKDEPFILAVLNLDKELDGHVDQ